MTILKPPSDGRIKLQGSAAGMTPQDCRAVRFAERVKASSIALPSAYAMEHRARSKAVPWDRWVVPRSDEGFFAQRRSTFDIMADEFTRNVARRDKYADRAVMLAILALALFIGATVLKIF